ncbi:MAG: lytic murein transglycosylase [Pseudomonadota bacterium]
MRRFLFTFALLAATPVMAQEHADMTPDALFMAQARFRDCLVGLWPQAQARGIRQDVFERELNAIEPDMPIIELMRKQPEFEKPLWSYIDTLVTRARIAKGKQMLAKYKASWPRMQQQFGVEPAILIALWAVETNFGGNIGGKSVIRSTATLACVGRRQDYFRNELLAALEIVQAGDVPSHHLRGSWAGAFGHTQFMPSTFRPYAVDFDGDGAKNIVDSVPDALASTANNLKQDGWSPGKTWGYEVVLPANFNLTLTGQTFTTGEWSAKGVQRTNGKSFPRSDDSASLVLPTGAGGPAFLLTKNFELLRRYNGSEAYAYAVGHLADRMVGGTSFKTKWPRHIRMLTSNERQELQQRLTAKGFDTGGAEGRLGAKTRAAIRAYQASKGLPADGFASPQLLQTLRNS